MKEIGRIIILRLRVRYVGLVGLILRSIIITVNCKITVNVQITEHFTENIRI